MKEKLSQLNIRELVGLWYDCISIDHHKTRDCIFEICKTWRYGEEPTYLVHHNGYRSDDICEDFKTLKEAESYLTEQLVNRIISEYEYAKEVVSGEQDDNWMGASKENMQKVIERVELS